MTTTNLLRITLSIYTQAAWSFNLRPDPVRIYPNEPYLHLQPFRSDDDHAPKIAGYHFVSTTIATNRPFDQVFDEASGDDSEDASGHHH